MERKLNLGVIGLGGRAASLLGVFVESTAVCGWRRWPTLTVTALAEPTPRHVEPAWYRFHMILAGYSKHPHPSPLPRRERGYAPLNLTIICKWERY